jgi:hypothetical protein
VVETVKAALGPAWIGCGSLEIGGAFGGGTERAVIGARFVGCGR